MLRPVGEEKGPPPIRIPSPSIPTRRDEKGLHGVIARLLAQEPMRQNQCPVNAVVDVKCPAG